MTPLSPALWVVWYAVGVSVYQSLDLMAAVTGAQHDACFSPVLFSQDPLGASLTHAAQWMELDRNEAAYTSNTFISGKYMRYVPNFASFANFGGSAPRFAQPQDRLRLTVGTHGGSTLAHRDATHNLLVVVEWRKAVRVWLGDRDSRGQEVEYRVEAGDAL